MAKNFNTLLEKMSDDRRARIKAGTAELIKDLPLDELRLAMGYTQVQLAKEMDVEQSAVSKIEHQTDIFVSTLRNFIHAMGGELEIRAKLPSGVFNIIQFTDVDQQPTKPKRSARPMERVSAPAR
jgi:hypothetical protein